MSLDLVCPRCGGTDFIEFDCGADSWDDDIFWLSYRCCGCELYYSGWTDKWLVDCDNWHYEGECEEYVTTGEETSET